MKGAILILGLVLLAGCGVYERARIAEQAKKDLVGLTKKDLYLCAGVPHREVILDDVEILEYVTTKTYSTEQGGSFSRDCTVSFTLRNGTVRRVRYSGSTGSLLAKDHQCAFVVRDCLSMTPN